MPYNMAIYQSYFLTGASAISVYVSGQQLSE
jgi:hypothetical protein